VLGVIALGFTVTYFLQLVENQLSEREMKNISQRVTSQAFEAESIQHSFNKLSELKKRIDSLITKQEAMLANLRLSQDTVVSSKQPYYDYHELENRIKINTEAIEQFNSIVLNRPETLVSLPLLNRDVESLRSEIDRLEKKIEMLQGINTATIAQMNEYLLDTAGMLKWVIGGILFTLLILVLQNTFTFRKQIKVEKKAEDGGE